MEGVSGDIITAKHKIQDKYLDTESQVGYPYVCHMFFQGSFCSLSFEVLKHALLLLISPVHWMVRVKCVDIFSCSFLQVVSALMSISKLKTDVQAYHQLGKDGYVISLCSLLIS